MIFSVLFCATLQAQEDSTSGSIDEGNISAEADARSLPDEAIKQESAEIESLEEASEKTPSPSTPLSSPVRRLVKENKYSKIRDFIPGDSAKVVALKTVLEEGLRKNPEQLIREERLNLLELNWSDTFEKFWLPNPQIGIQSSNQKIHQIMSGSIGGTNRSRTTKTPQGNVFFSLGQYNIFNWGRDYLQYQNDQASYKRNKETLGEEKRRLKFKLVAQYFDLVRIKSFERIAREQLQHLTFIYRLAKERAQLGKISKQHFYEVRTEYLKGQNAYHEVQVQSAQINQALANTLGDDLSSTYKSEEKLLFKKVDVPLKDALDSAVERYPQARDHKLALENNTRSWELSLKDNLPLPTFSVDLGTYSHSFGRNGGGTTFETTPGDSNVQVVATLNMTWNLVGEGGLLNTRRNQRSYVNKRISEINFYNTRRYVELTLRQLYQGIYQLENQVEISEAQVENTHKAFDVILDNYVSSSTAFDLFRDALYNLRDTEYTLENVKFLHLQKKLELSDLMGVEDLPGTPFENLAIKGATP